MVETILIESSTPMTSSTVGIESASDMDNKNDSYFNAKLKKLYKDLDKTLQMSYRVLNRNSMSRGNGVCSMARSNTTNEEETATICSTNRIYKGELNTSRSSGGVTANNDVSLAYSSESSTGSKSVDTSVIEAAVNEMEEDQ